MAQRGYGSGDIPPRVLLRGSGNVWLYDAVNEEFLCAPPDRPRRRALAPRELRPAFRRTPRTRVGRFARWLLVDGGLCVVLLVGLMAFALVGVALGYR